MKNKKSRERRVLLGALGVAGVMIAGSTFAWFTSQDEVTNRLTASANYGVSIVEDFEPPKELTPGQSVKKNVSVVNTGNIDALVRVQFENLLKLTSYDGQAITLGTADMTEQGTGTDKYNITDFNPVYPTIPAGQTAVTLSPKAYIDANGNMYANEVTLLQAGGELVVAAGKAVDVKDQAIKSGDAQNNDYNGADQYKPAETGLYIFRRTYYETVGDEKEKNKVVRYSGYWYTQNSNSTTVGDGVYTALVTDTDGTNATAYLPDDAVTESDAGTGKVVTRLDASKIKIKTTKELTLENTALNLTCEFGKLSDAGETWTPVEAGETPSKDNATHIKVTYDPTKNDTQNSTSDDIVFYLTMDSAWSDNWKYVNDPTGVTNGKAVGESADYGTAFGHFYLVDDLQAGATSPKLITDVQMSSKVTQHAFVDLTYDINVVLESVQIAFDVDGTELMPGGTKDNNAAAPWEHGAKGTADVTGTEISSIDWDKE